jgi:hypothetical protein
VFLACDLPDASPAKLFTVRRMAFHHLRGEKKRVAAQEMAEKDSN